MIDKIRVAILDDHPATSAGYRMYLKDSTDIEVVAMLRYGCELEPFLLQNPVDVLMLDIKVCTSPDNPNPYPILYMIPKLLDMYPETAILAASMYGQRALIHAIMGAGASGYLLKDDIYSLQNLDDVIKRVYGGEIYMSPQAYTEWMKHPAEEAGQILSPRQREALSLCAAYPDFSVSELAKAMNIAGSTMRNLLSMTYLRLNVRTRTAAVLKARQLGLISPDSDRLDIGTLQNP
jgi:DNA-binding NarL/FixJ family response regulator